MYLWAEPGTQMPLFAAAKTSRATSSDALLYERGSPVSSMPPLRSTKPHPVLGELLVTPAPQFRSYREIDEARRQEAIARGYRGRHFFPHQTRYVRKWGPDGFRLAMRMCGPRQPAEGWEILLYATGDVLAGLPPELFFDDDIVWHQQQLGLPGQIATATLVVNGSRLFTIGHVSDIVQRISRRRQYKTQVEKRFAGWHHMLLNSIGNFAVEFGCSEVLIPTSDLAIQNTALFGSVGRELFERIYDRNVRSVFEVERRDRWWVMDLARNRSRIVMATRNREPAARTKRICVCHDIEGGSGSREQPDFARRADRVSAKTVSAMLEVEDRLGISATYNVVGCMLPSVRTAIDRHQHCIAFHSYDHRAERRSIRAALRAWAAAWLVSRPVQPEEPAFYQLARCRTIDYRLKGYRVPKSRMTPELTPANLCYHNFEWLASSRRSLGTSHPVLNDRVVYIPVHFDDWVLHRRRMHYREWEAQVIAGIAAADFVAFGLHDCYADHWLPFYERLLRKVRDLGVCSTLDAVSAAVFLDHAA